MHCLLDSMSACALSRMCSSNKRESELLRLLHLDGLLPACHDSLRFHSHDASAPSPPVFNVVVVLRPVIVAKSIQLGLVLLPNTGQSNARCCLLVYKATQTGLALDNAVWNILLAAQSWKPADQLDGVHIMRNHHHFCLL